jgi:glycosyltransferase involved in cell wall biosynthesis
MKFSVLLPTRNRLYYLKFALQSVLRQGYEDWEVIVSDNASEDDIAGHVRSLNDPRIKYYRTDRFVPVTENWNNALARSSGDYVVMLGDDDCLMQGYFQTVDGLTREYDSPDLIYLAGYLFAYPGVLPGHPHGFLQLYRQAIFDSSEPFLLARERARAIVRASLSFKMHAAYNMQYSVIHRRMIDAAKPRGDFFQSPYPDFYATNALFLTADRILICPRPLVTIGISPKSYGFYHFNNKEADGMAFLNNAPDAESVRKLAHVLLPGNKNLTSWLLALERLHENYGPELGRRPGYARYRLLQTAAVYKNYYLDGRVSRAELGELRGRLKWWERLVYGGGLVTAFSLVCALPAGPRARLLGWLTRASVGQADELGRATGDRRFETILDVFEQVTPSHDPVYRGDPRLQP